MINVNIKLIFVMLVSLVNLFTLNAGAFTFEISPDKILIGKNSLKDGDVYLHKFSIVKVSKNIKRAVHSVVIDKYFDKHTEEYTADYNCLNRTQELIKVSIIEGSKIVDNKITSGSKKVEDNSIESKLLDVVCTYNNSKLAPKHKL